MSEEPAVVVEEKAKKAPKPKYEGPACSVCGKPLTDPESVKAGIGPLCRAKGWTKEMWQAKMAELKSDTVPEGFVKLSEVADLCRKENIPVSRLVRAVGGDRGMEEPAHPKFKVMYVGRARYLDPWVVTEEGLNLMRDPNLGKPAPEKKVREKKEKAPGEAKVAKPKVEKAVPVKTAEDPW
jgi:hypothetical protein